LDGKKPLFQVKTKLVSSVYSHDEKLHNFFSSLQDASRTSGEEPLIKVLSFFFFFFSFFYLFL